MEVRNHKSLSSKSYRDRMIRQLMNNRAFILFALIVIIMGVMTVLYTNRFFSFDNFAGILLNLSLEAICAVGMMYLIVSGVFDLSIGSNFTLASAITAALIKTDSLFGIPLTISVPLAIFFALAISALVGLTNGVLVAKVGINALIATLAMMFILRGIAINMAGSGLVIDSFHNFVVIGQKVILGLQIPIYYMIAFVLIGAFLLAKTRFFRQFYYIGGNKKSAALSGIHVDRLLIINFVIMGALAGLCGIVFAARMNKGSGIYAETLNLDVITAVIIGGGSLAGGRGTVLGAFMGVLFLHLIKNIMVIIGVNPYIQPIITGLILIAAVTIDVFLQKRYKG